MEKAERVTDTDTSENQKHKHRNRHRHRHRHRETGTEAHTETEIDRDSGSFLLVSGSGVTQRTGPCVAIWVLKRNPRPWGGQHRPQKTLSKALLRP